MRHSVWILAIAALAISFAPFAQGQQPADEVSSSGNEPTSANSILNLYDAFGYGKRGTVLDWGYSALVRYNGKTILFDSGNNTEIFEHNVRALGIDLSKLDFAVLSHYHADHFSGFDYLLRVNPNVKIYLPNEPELGAPDEFTFSTQTKAELEGMQPEQLYFGGKKKFDGLPCHRQLSAFESRVCPQESGSRAGSVCHRDACSDDGLLRRLSAQFHGSS